LVAVPPVGGALVIADVIFEALMGVLLLQTGGNIAGGVVTQTVTNQIEQEVTKQVIKQAVTNQVEQEVAKQVVTQTTSLWLKAIPWIGWGITAVSFTYVVIKIITKIKEGQEFKALLSKPGELTLEKVPAKHLDTVIAAVFVKIHGSNNPKSSSAFNLKVSEKMQKYGTCLCKPPCPCVPPCKCQSRRDEDTPVFDGDKFDLPTPNDRGKAYRNKKTREMFAEDTVHGDHYDVYKNLDEFKKKNKKPRRTVYFNGFLKDHCC